MRELPSTTAVETPTAGDARTAEPAAHTDAGSRFQPVLDTVDALSDGIARHVPSVIADRAGPVLERFAARFEQGVEKVYARLFPTEPYEPPIYALPEHLVAPPDATREERLALDQRQLAELQESPRLREFAVNHFAVRMQDCPAGKIMVGYGPADFDNWSNTRHVPEDPDRTLVFVHGQTNLVKCDGVVLDAEGFAEVLRAADLPEDRLLRLVACDTGKGEECFAQRLADLLGRDIEAPTEVVWSRFSGELPVSSVASRDEYGREFATTPDDGEWKVFRPRG